MKLSQVVLLISGMWQLMIILEIFASRGMSTNELQKCKLWWHGPNWLSQGKDNWPLWNVHKVSKEILADISKEIKAPKTMFEIFFTAGEGPLEISHERYRRRILQPVHLLLITT